MQDHWLLVTIATVGATLGLGQLLANGERLTWRKAAGRAIVSGGLGLCAGAAFIMWPTLPLPATIGLSCVLVSLGTSSLERLFQRVIGGK